jgi:LEA14-like dessication related protein
MCLKAITLYVVIATVLAGCGSAIFREPEVHLENVQLAGLGLRGGTLKVTVEIGNPNPFALGADEVHYRLEIAEAAGPTDTTWVDLANGSYAEGISVGAGRTERVVVPVEFTYAGLGGAASSVLRAGTFAYRATGTVDVSTPLGSRRVPFDRGGVVSVIGAH